MPAGLGCHYTAKPNAAKPKRGRRRKRGDLDLESLWCFASQPGPGGPPWAGAVRRG